jgi:hypothetical protein
MDANPLADSQAPEGGWRDAADVGTDEARDAWAEAAHDVLVDTARDYQAVVTHKELARDVQARTGIRTSKAMHNWIGDVLKQVARSAHRREEPLLPALCVNSSGSVGAAYAGAVAATKNDLNGDDADDHAALERLRCYRHFEAEGLPADGGKPALTPQWSAKRSRERKVRHAERAVPICPNCYTAVPATGVCDNCS